MKRMRTMAMAIRRKQAKIDDLLKEAPIVHEELSEDLTAIMEGADEDIQKLPNTDFKKIFWEQQVLCIYICMCLWIVYTNICCAYVCVHYP